MWQTTSKNFTQGRAAREARLIFLIQPIRSLFSGVVVAMPSSLLPNEADVSTAGPSSQRMTNFAERNSERMTNFAERIQDKEKGQDWAAYHVQDICPSLQSDTLKHCHASQGNVIEICYAIVRALPACLTDLRLTSIAMESWTSRAAWMRVFHSFGTLK